VKDEFIATYQQEYPVSTMCRVLKVEMGGFSAWLQRPPIGWGPREYKVGRAHLSGQPPGVWQFAHSRNAAGASERRGSCANTASMRSQASIAPAPPTATTASHTKWVADITAIWTAEGWLYLAVVLDIFSRMVVGWAMDAHRDEALVDQAARMALMRRHPDPGLTSHSEHGSL
jgi:putative transposase